MKIGIDISQLAYEKTGVANYLFHLVEGLLKLETKNEFILFYSSLRTKITNYELRFKYINSNVKIKSFNLPPILLDIFWNKLHIFPIEWFVGDVDIFVTSDWTEPPTIKAKKATILYDLIVSKYPHETDNKIVVTQKRKLEWVKKETDMILCISESTKKDAMEILGIEETRLKVIYPGLKTL